MISQINKISRRFISVLLSVAIVFASLTFLSPFVSSIEGELPNVEKEPEHVMRLSDSEPNLYTRIWLNEDGTRTMEYFGEPVKFIDGEGNTVDKLLTFKKERLGFTAEQSDISYFFNENIGDGIALSYDKTEISMFPVGLDGEARLSDNHEKLIYAVTGDTVYEYLLTYSGYKEEIVVFEFNGQTEYKFIYNTNGAIVTQSEGNTFISDEQGNTLATFSDIIVFTADEKNNSLGELIVEELKKNERYEITIKLDPEFLSDPDTAYPITIDPSIDIVYGENGVDGSYIEDVTINSNAGSSGSKASVFVGNISSSGIQRLLVSFPGLDLSPILTSAYIVSAKYHMRDLMCYSTHLPVEVHKFNSTWYESSVNWSNTNPNNYTSTVLDTQTVYYRHGNYIPDGQTYSNTYAFDITDAVKAWKSSGSNNYKHQGVIFKTTSDLEGSTTYRNACFASFERASNKPSLHIIYNDPTPIVTTTNIVVSSGSTFSIQYYVYNATATFSSGDTSVATVSSTGVITGVSDGLTTVTVSFYREGALVSSVTCTVFVGTERYVFFRDDGKALKYDMGYPGVEYYNPNMLHCIQMVFMSAGGSGEFYIVPRYYSGVALTANSSGTVTFAAFNSTNKPNQKWKYVTVSTDCYLQSLSTDPTINGKKICRSGNQIVLSQTTFSHAVTVLSDNFVPVTGISLDNLTFPDDHGSQYIYSTMTPSNASYGRNATTWHTYSTGNSNIAYFDNNNRLNIVSEGVTTVTVTHKITQVHVTAILTVTSYFDSNHSCNKTWFIKDTSNGAARYLEIPINTDNTNGLGADIPVNWTMGDNSVLSHRVWKLVKIEGEGCYAICATHSDNQFLTCYTGIGAVETDIYDGSTYNESFKTSLANRDKWKFQYDSTLLRYRIVSLDDTTKCLCTGANGAVSLSSITSANNFGYNWKIDECPNDSYFDEHYTNANKPENVYVALDIYHSGTYNYETQDWNTSTVSYNDVKNCVESWNGISSHVSVTCVRLSDVTPDMNVIATIVRATTQYHDYQSNDDPIYPVTQKTLGYTNTITNGNERSYNSVNEEYYLDERFDSAVVYVAETTLPGYTLTVSMIKSIITHEIGHVLKLKHLPDQNGVPIEKSSYPSLMRFIDQESGNTYLHSQLGVQSHSITIFDKEALIRKWGL